MRTRPEQAIEPMTRFAERTDLTPDRLQQRYLWTEAFAVCNFLGIAPTIAAPTGETVQARLRVGQRVNLRGAEGLGISLDWARSTSAGGPLAEIGRPGAPVRVLVARTDEELQIAREPLATVRGAPPG
jgi:hypothetical protein